MCTKVRPLRAHVAAPCLLSHGLRPGRSVMGGKSRTQELPPISEAKVVAVLCSELRMDGVCAGD